ncbi:hypothetical protein F4677DRAFT_451272 [Hypoxylon crocopeplum]|nr:hypothetical protein F4677DRAFT_451272 [Hypoxylon crocopeplum]
MSSMRVPIATLTKFWAFDEAQEAQEARGDPLASEIMADILWRNMIASGHCLPSVTSLELQKMKDFLKCHHLSVGLEWKFRNSYVLHVDKFLEVICVHAWNISFKEDDKMNSQQWLKDRPTNFKFTDQEDGPDLLFFLETPDRTSNILCAVQFKTGIEGTAKKPYNTHALHTLALKRWKTGNMGPCPVIHIYVANAVDIDESTFKECLASTPSGVGGKGWDRTKLRDNDFICYMDRKRSKDVFGETFDTFLELLKNQPIDGNGESDAPSV